MDKKIKSVKLAKDYRTIEIYLPKGAEFHKSPLYWEYNINSSNTFRVTESDILNCKTDLFDVEYEPERKSITVKIEYEKVKEINSDLTPQIIEDTFIMGNMQEYLDIISITEVTND